MFYKKENMELLSNFFFDTQLKSSFYETKVVIASEQAKMNSKLETRKVAMSGRVRRKRITASKVGGTCKKPNELNKFGGTSPHDLDQIWKLLLNSRI